MQFVSFQASFPGLKVAMESKEPGLERKQIAGILHKARCVSALKAYDYAPIDAQAIRAIAAKEGKIPSMPALAAILRQTSLSKLTELLRPATKLQQVDESKKQAEEKKIEYAIDFYLHLLFSQVFAQDVSPTAGVPQKSDVRLVANTATWQAVKKADAALPAKEVLAGLIGIMETARNKHADFLCKEGGAFDGACAELLAKLSPRKSFGKMLQVLEFDEKAIEEKMIQLALEPQNKDDLANLKELFYLEALAQAGYSPYVPVGLLNETYPELKIPKPRGNFGGKKKKK